MKLQFIAMPVQCTTSPWPVFWRQGHTFFHINIINVHGIDYIIPFKEFMLFVVFDEFTSTLHLTISRYKSVNNVDDQSLNLTIKILTSHRGLALFS